MKRALSRRLWPWGVLLLVVLAWDRAAWLHLSPRDDGRAAEFTSFPLYEEPSVPFPAPADRREGGLKAVSLRSGEAKHHIEGKPWYMLLYVFGRYEPWLILSAWLVFSGVGAGVGAGEGWEQGGESFRRGVRQALTLTGSILVAGLAAELVKVTLRRVRPEFADGWFVYVPFWETAPAGVSFGMPSSHAAVAVAAAIAVGRMVPSTRWALYPLAAGCALSRVLVGAHFLSDVYVGALLGVVGERWVCGLSGSRQASADRGTGQ